MKLLSAIVVSVAFGFQAPPTATRSATSLSAMSKSIPFLTAPKNLDGMVGNEEFDPLGFCEIFDPKYMRESELKHGRVAMLATLGFVAPEFGLRFPGAPAEVYGHANPLIAATSIPASSWAGLIFASGVVEYLSYNGKMSMMDMFDDGREAGAFGYDPSKLMTSENSEDFQLKELTHGRAAMIGIGGMIHGAFVTGEGVLGSTT